MYKSRIQKELLIDNKSCSSDLSLKHNFFVGIIQSLFSFEILFVLFLFAWAFKADPRFQQVPIDLTELFFILSVITGTLVFLGEKKKFGGKAAVLALSGAIFALYVLISLTWSVSHINAAPKALHLSVLTLWALIACTYIIASDKRRLGRFINLLMIVITWVGIESALEYTKVAGDVINALNSNYLALGYTIGMGLLISAAYVFFTEQSRFKKIVMLILALFFMFLLFVLGGRGPLISATISLLIPLLCRNRLVLYHKLKFKKYFVFIVVLLLAAVLISIYLYSKASPTATLARMLLLFEPGMGTSAGTRAVYYLDSYKIWLLKPLLGHGIGSWPILMGLPDLQYYPHNLILEIMTELGLIGLMLFGLVLFLALKGFILPKHKNNIFFSIVILMMFVNAFIGAMFSGDINDNRFIFAVLGLMAFDGGKSEENEK